MGKCLTIVKLVGIGSLGLSSSIFLISSYKSVPALLNKSETVTQLKEKVSSLITKLRLSFWSLGSLATYLFYQAYACSPSYGKHPYLVYSALAFPIALIFNYYYNYSDEQKLISDTEETIIYKTEKKIIQEIQTPEEETSPLDNSVYNDLGSSSPKVVEKEIDIQVPHVSKIEIDEVSYKSLLSSVRRNYLYSGIIMGSGSLLGLIGYAGDNLK